MEKKCIDLATHAIGLDYKKPYIRHGKKFYRPYRNYYMCVKNCDIYDAWNFMESNGYAKSKESNQGVYFWLTRDGLDWLGEKIGVHIYDEEE